MSLALRQTARLLLSRPSLGDLPDLARMHADERVMATLGGLRSEDETRQGLLRHIAHWDEHGYGWWIAREPQTDQFIGRGGLRHLTIEDEPVVEVGYGLLAEYWGQGLATELARESVRVAFDELKLPALVCFTMTTNFASQRVMQKAGFTYERDFIHANLPHVLYRLKP